ncbi:hypothetical protein [Hymenobacter ruricola]|uniref:DUF4468 domain-containing protein n=1 Tax=Hymenobacter ruricola TaxID=2791023 RepID=A0ABS0HY87_9BACT|nr:hypothetical protein [Hymenobacter ruricola]MBF9219622.1 hypothetical protein [Hymenobacter ruricola]
MQKFYFFLLLLAGWLAPALASAQLYDVRPGEVNYNKKPRPALKVQVDGKATDVREYLQDWMKSSYNVKFKAGGVLGMGKNDVLMAKQTPASTISGKLVDLYATVIAPSDSVSEVSFFGGFDDHTFFDADNTKAEYNALRAIAQNFAGAARLKAYRDMIAEAEKKLKAVEKEKERLEKEQAYLKTNTESNLARIEELKRKNAENLLQSRTDSASQTKNRLLLDESRLRLQRRRDRLSALDRKN